jgi:hypothetical protein
MKTLLVALLLIAGTATAQVTRTTQTIDKKRLDGYAATTSIDAKFVEQEFRKKLTEYGRVEGGRGALRVNFARLPFLDNGKLIGEVKSVRKETRLFLAAAQGTNDEPVPDSRVGEILTDFLRSLDYAEQVRQADQGVETAEKQHQDMIKKGERLLRDIEKNKKDHERLLKQTQENEADLVRLQAELEQNKLDQETAIRTLDDKKTEAARVKTRN